MEQIGKLFGAQQGPTAAEKALQADQYQKASRADAEADQRLALASRASSLRKSLAYRDQSRKSTLGG
ncbi:hypothetical protein [Oricola sp.]|uniref:hypothetical protein n=1 Tax=Oricola sp. TaxID=1979950 RepID=UPI0025E32D6E|nr:hypothetical protein [Oricola sp.]MCI5075652.1 hypothetical protein [Oricola sp.]